MPVTTDQTDDARQRARRRRHGWMLVLAIEVLVFGATQSVLRPVRSPGVVVEQSVTPNHIVT